jgi:hypothetical protein
MQAGSDRYPKLIAWNGVRLFIPAVWESRVTAPCHLVFEAEFLPLLQLRWHKEPHHSPKDLQRIIAEFSASTTAVIAGDELAAEWRRFEARFQLLACSGDRDGAVTGGIFCCPQCQTIFQFQLLSGNAPRDHEPMSQAVGDCLATLSCHGHREELWRIHDFSLITPPPFALTDYCFKAGLTSLSFDAQDLTLETCTLAPADVRLNRQSLAEILRTLAAVPDLDLRQDNDPESCEGFRSPGIANRAILRMRRRKPFIEARIRHDSARNRLLTLILSSARPIPATMLPALAGDYAIV